MPVMSTALPITTAEQLWEAPDLGPCELVRGELIMMTPAGYEHGRICGNLCFLLRRFVSQHRLGEVVTGEPGFVIARDPDTVRAPDVAFVRAERVPPAGSRGFFQGAPDLAVEVLSPTDRAGEVLAKVRDWLASGSLAVWVVDPRTQTVSVYHGRSEVTILSAGDTLGGGEVLPGFSLPVAEVFAA
jgi:Uma2 family endonuclease